MNRASKSLKLKVDDPFLIDEFLVGGGGGATLRLGGGGGKALTGAVR